MQKSILINCIGNGDWLGGLYYSKNFAIQLSFCEQFAKKYSLFLCVSKNQVNLFNDVPKSVRLVTKESIEKNAFSFLHFLLANHVKVIFPIMGYRRIKKVFLCLLGVLPIYWIPDFQHLHLPEFFSEAEVRSRNKEDGQMLNHRNKVLLSSEAARSDALKYFDCSECQIFVVPFVSSLFLDFNNLSRKEEEMFLFRNGLVNGNFAYVGNQFWKHKNHQIIFDSLDYLEQKNVPINFKIVFTGKMADYRNPEYIESTKNNLDKYTKKGIIVYLGLVTRNEQMYLLHNAKFVIQPSLFEGWGTVVEDAKVFDKTILLSDIPVHREQMTKKTILFNPYDKVDCASKILSLFKSNSSDNVEEGIMNTKKSIDKYSKKFMECINE